MQEYGEATKVMDKVMELAQKTQNEDLPLITVNFGSVYMRQVLIFN